VYDLDSPVARTSVGGLSGPSSVVSPGADAVMCLSCHYSHAGPYDDMLRWDYTTMVAGGGTTSPSGCFACHTTKD
ncbi:MAG: cytochrome c3 family protein, partial [Desulfobulbaceae bacterium]|nr:cytochrome c3 family protein [Desulfobulbaceae bacterium]